MTLLWISTVLVSSYFHFREKSNKKSNASISYCHFGIHTNTHVECAPKIDPTDSLKMEFKRLNRIYFHLFEKIEQDEIRWNIRGGNELFKGVCNSKSSLGLLEKFIVYSIFTIIFSAFFCTASSKSVLYILVPYVFKSEKNVVQ